MNLHENKKLFTDAVLAASEYLDIRPVYIEKDYWITRSLKLMTQNSNADKAIFKGGTSLSKAHKSQRHNRNERVEVVGSVARADINVMLYLSCLELEL